MPAHDIKILLEIIRHLGGCRKCFRDHGEYPESVSCCCSCHRGYADRWATLQELTYQALGVPHE